MADLQQALALMRQGQPDRAAAACAQVLAQDPDNFGARHLLGVTLLMRGDAAAAEREIARAIDLDPSVAGAHYNRGNALLALGRPQAAADCHATALRLKPDFAEACRNLGDALASLGRTDEAIAHYRRALSINPALPGAGLALAEQQVARGRHGEALAALDAVLRAAPADAAAWNCRGNALYGLGRFEAAVDAYGRALAVAPSLADVHDNRGLALQALRRYEAALASHDAALALQPGLGIAHHRRALALRMLKRFDDALAAAERAVALMPGSALAVSGRGGILNDLGRYEEAAEAFRAAIALAPAFAEAHNNLGNALYDLGRLDEALAALDAALALRPGYPLALSNRGLVLQDARRFEEARAAYDAAIAARPDDAEAYKRRASLHLLRGDSDRGWADMDASLFHARGGSIDADGIRYWNGEPLQGRAILLTEPNGYGDTLQFWRFIPALLEMGAQVSFLGSPRLFRLLRSAPWPVRLLERLPAGERFDFRSELWSLPRVLRTRLDALPVPVPYLAPEPARVEAWSRWLGTGGLDIGICWQGNPERKVDAGRSVPLAAFAPLAAVDGVRLVSLQRVHGLEQLSSLPAGMRVVQPDPPLDAGDDAFVDTAALMASLDLVVCSDTAIAHLAGALGRPTWLALKHAPEWRWMLDRPDSPWYPTLRLFRQPRPGDWDAVFDQMRAALGQRG